MKIITLIENLVYQAGLLSEHGLSIYIDTGNRKLLFDTGQSSAFLSNARILGIDAEEIDAVIISHGHYDHTGGLDAFFQANKKATLYIKPEAFAEKYQGKNRTVGIPEIPAIPGNRIKYVESVTELYDGIFVMPDIPVLNPADTSFHNFFIKKGSTFMKDEFKDELFLTFVRNNKLSVISSCSHRGITHMVRESIRYFNLPVHMLLGGFHLRNCPPEQYQLVISYLKQIKPELIGVSHCTGVEKYSELRKDLPFHIFYNMTANVLQI